MLKPKISDWNIMYVLIIVLQGSEDIKVFGLLGKRLLVVDFLAGLFES